MLLVLANFRKYIPVNTLSIMVRKGNKRDFTIILLLIIKPYKLYFPLLFIIIQIAMIMCPRTEHQLYNSSK